jgi:hypothetical protein
MKKAAGVWGAVASPRRTVGAERVVSNFVSEKALRGALMVTVIFLIQLLFLG